MNINGISKSFHPVFGTRKSSPNGTNQSGEFSAQLSKALAEFTRDVKKELSHENGDAGDSYSNLGELMTGYREWKAQRPSQTLPDAQGLTAENISYLREQYSGKLSTFQKIEALDVLRQMGIITWQQEDEALGRNMKSISKDVTITVLPLDEGNDTPSDKMLNDSWLEQFRQQTLVLSKTQNLDMLLEWVNKLDDQPE